MCSLERIKSVVKYVHEEDGRVIVASITQPVRSMQRWQRLLLREVGPAMDRGHLLRLVAIEPKILADVRQAPCMMGSSAKRLILHLVELDIVRPGLCGTRWWRVQQRGHVMYGPIWRCSLLEEIARRDLCRGVQCCSRLRCSAIWRCCSRGLMLWAVVSRRLLGMRDVLLRGSG